MSAIWNGGIQPGCNWTFRNFRKLVRVDEYYQKERITFSEKYPTAYTQLLHILNDLHFLVNYQDEGTKNENENENEGEKEEGTKGHWTFREPSHNDRRRLWIAGHSLG